MKKLLLLAIPLLLFSFTFPGDTPKKVNASTLQEAHPLEVVCCKNTTYIRVKIADADAPTSGNVYWHIDGLHVATNVTLLDVPYSANSVYATVGTSYPGLMYAGNMLSQLTSQCGSKPSCR